MCQYSAQLHRLIAAAVFAATMLAWLTGAQVVAQESPLPVWINNGCGGMVMAPQECHVVTMTYYFPMVAR